MHEHADPIKHYLLVHLVVILERDKVPIHDLEFAVRPLRAEYFYGVGIALESSKLSDPQLKLRLVLHFLHELKESLQAGKLFKALEEALDIHLTVNCTSLCLLLQYLLVFVGLETALDGPGVFNKFGVSSLSEVVVALPTRKFSLIIARSEGSITYITASSCQELSNVRNVEGVLWLIEATFFRS